MMRGSCWIAVAALCACAADSPAPPAQHVESVPAQASCKPEAPIAVSLTSRPLQAGRYELTITATPTKAVDAVELAFVLPPGAQVDRPRARFGATAAAQPRVLVAVVEASARTTEISALARVPVAVANEPPIEMSRSTTIALGEPKPVPRTRVYAIDGELAREVRP